jgi:His-Xaa-Ser system protein HxsD
MTFEINNNQILLKIDSSIYSIDILHKCFYWYGAAFNVDVNNAHENFIVKIEPKCLTNTDQDLNAICEKISRDLIDFKLRDIVTKETKTIRELIVAKAFAYYDTDSNPSSDISDPVGFTTKSIKS